MTCSLERNVDTMKLLKRLLMVMLIILGAYYLVTNPEIIQRNETEIDQKELLLEKKQNIQLPKKSSLDITLASWIGKSVDDLLTQYGEPLRKDLAPYGYTSYVYLEEYTKYTVFGIENNEVVTVFSTGSQIDLGDIYIGQSYDELHQELQFSDEIKFRKGTSVYNLKLKKEDLMTRPLVKVGNDIFIQFYFDTMMNKLSAIRVLKGETLLLQQSYELVYQGNLPELEVLTDEEWETIERGQEEQTFELTNIIRNIYGHNNLLWEKEVGKVAYAHSKDMENNDYFSHESPTGEGLLDRLTYHEITYQLAGENIAANYPDALATVIGWLNSEGHRESLLNEEFTHIGIGVFKMYYTQNFLRK